MDPQFDKPKPNSLNLPPPVVESGANVPALAENMPVPEQAAPAPERVGELPPPPAPTTTQQPASAVDPISAAAAPSQPAPGVTPTTTAATPPLADDGDLIEKEWVNKAKQIVDQTREDPHRQTKEITVFKADYMKKRYNKVLKLSE